MEYTKGEWKVISAGFTDSGVLYEVIMPKQEICIANAHLIAAAPDMYEALLEIRKLIKIYSPRSKMGGDIRLLIQEALAKADIK